MDLDDVRAELGEQAVLSHATAAQLHGFPVYGRHRPAVTVPRSWGHVRLPGVSVHRVDLADNEITVIDGSRVTTAVRTVTDCGRVMELREAVAVADAALRLGRLDQGMAMLAAQRLRGPGTTTAARALRWADGRAGSGNESLARVSLLLAGLGPVEPQGLIVPGPYEHPVDLLLRWARVAVECESAAHHALWPAVMTDIAHHDRANRAGFTLVRTHQREIWPSDLVFVRKVLGAVCEAPGRRAQRVRDRRDLADLPAR